MLALAPKQRVSRVESGEFSLVDVSDEKKGKPLDPEAPSLVKVLMRGMFKADHPYRTRLGLSGTMTTSSSGILNFGAACSLLSTVAEWASIDALFDEYFVHSMTVRFSPANAGGGGWTTVTGTVGGQPTYAAATAVVTSIGLCAVALQSTTSFYSAMSSMVANPTLRHFLSNKPFSFAWRNNVRFDPHGISLGTSSALGWQGWASVGSTASLGGLIQIRAHNDIALGDETHAYALGAYTLLFDVSFRSRS